MPKFRVEYSSNNSGGRWWLRDRDWIALERAGWAVNWIRDNEYYKGEERFLDALATSASKEYEAVTMSGAERKATADWEDITGAYASDRGCNCCGQPHYFYAREIGDAESQ